MERGNYITDSQVVKRAKEAVSMMEKETIGSE